MNFPNFYIEIFKAMFKLPFLNWVFGSILLLGLVLLVRVMIKGGFNK